MHMVFATVGPVLLVAVLLGLAGYTAVWLSRPASGPALGSHYNPARYAGGEAASKPTDVGICDRCGVRTDPSREHCPVCPGSVRDLSGDG